MRLTSSAVEEVELHAMLFTHLQQARYQHLRVAALRLPPAAKQLLKDRTAEKHGNVAHSGLKILTTAVRVCAIQRQLPCGNS